MQETSRNETIWAFVLGALYGTSDGTPKHTRSELLEMFLDLVPVKRSQKMAILKEVMEASAGTDPQPIRQWLYDQGVMLQKGQTVFRSLEDTMRLELAVEKAKAVQSVLDLKVPSGSEDEYLEVLEEYIDGAREALDTAKQIRSRSQGSEDVMGRDGSAQQAGDDPVRVPSGDGPAGGD